jgi:hypothetical protein
MTTKTFAIYLDTTDGLLRVGTFKPRNATSVRHIADQFFAKQPNLPRGKVYIANRYRDSQTEGGWADDVAGRVLLT